MQKTHANAERSSEPKLDRVPPQNIDAEIAVLGAMMTGEDSMLVVSQVVEIINADVFYREAHKKIFEAILDLYHEDKPADLITVTQKLEANGDLEAVGGVPRLDEMIESVPTVENVAHYARLLRDPYAKRRAIRLSARLYNEAFDDTEEIFDRLSSVQAELLEIQSDVDKKEIISAKDLVRLAFKRVQQASVDPDSVAGLATGFPDLDRFVSGFQGGDVIIIAGRPSIGKSMLAQNILESICVQEKHPALFFSLEMSQMQIGVRMLSSVSGIGFGALQRGSLREEDWPLLTMGAGRLSEAPLYIDDTANLTTTQLRSRCYRYKIQYNIELIVLDYIQLMRDPEYNETGEREMAAISRTLKLIAKDLDVPVVAVSQLSRECEKRHDKRPMLSDLRMSGAIEQDADVVMFVYREKYYNPQEGDDTAEIIIAKQRNGTTGTAKLGFDPHHARFNSLGKSR